MKNSMIALAGLGSVLYPSATYATEQLPSNVTTKLYGGTSNKVIDAIDYSFPSSRPIDFSRVKMCIVENVTNNGVQLSDHAGSFVGYGGTYYRSHNSSTVQGGEVFKYVDDASKSLVAGGSISRRGGFGGLLGLSIRFDLEVSLTDSQVKMRMMHIEQAMTSTGSSSNDGYGPILVSWTSSLYKKDIKALDDSVAQLKACFAT